MEPIDRGYKRLPIKQIIKPGGEDKCRTEEVEFMSIRLVICFGMVLFVIAAVGLLRPEHQDTSRLEPSATQQSKF